MKCVWEGTKKALCTVEFQVFGERRNVSPPVIALLNSRSLASRRDVSPPVIALPPADLRRAARWGFQQTQSTV